MCIERLQCKESCSSVRGNGLLTLYFSVAFSRQTQTIQLAHSKMDAESYLASLAVSASTTG